MLAVRIVVGVIVGIGLLEMAMTSIAALAGLASWNARFTDLTRAHPSTTLRLTMGVAACVAAVSLGIGYARPVWWIVGGAVLTLYAGTILARQIACGDTGPALVAYTLFATCGIVAVAAGVVTA